MGRNRQIVEIGAIKRQPGVDYLTKSGFRLQSHRRLLSIPDRLAVVCKFCPNKETTATASTRLPTNLTHPHVPSSVGFLLLHRLQHCWDATFAFGSELWMEALTVPPVCNVDSLVARHRVWINGSCRRDTVLPLLLHLGMHNQQRIVGQMYGDLA